MTEHATISVPHASFHDALRTRETTALEPAVVVHKNYVAGLGHVEEVAVRGPLEELVLVDVLN